MLSPVQLPTGRMAQTNVPVDRLRIGAAVTLLVLEAVVVMALFALVLAWL